MKNLIIALFLLVSSIGISQTAVYNKMIVGDQELEISTTMVNCGYELNGVYSSIFTFASTDGVKNRQVSLTGTGYERDEQYIYVYCYNNVGNEFVILFNHDYTYASITRAADEKVIVEYLLEEETEVKPEILNKI